MTWEVLEQDVYSSADTAEERQREEDLYLKNALGGHPTIVQDLTEIGGTDVRAQLLRERRPFSLRATARFRDLEHALSALVEAAEMDAEIRLRSAGDRRVLTITPLELGPRPRDDEEQTLNELFRSDEFRLVMTHGEFVEAHGFRIEDEGRVAAWADDPDGRSIERYRLVWSVRE